MSFEDKLNKFLKESSEKHDQLKTRDNRRSNYRQKETMVSIIKTGSTGFYTLFLKFYQNSTSNSKYFT